ncbi:protein FAR1-RELATED SEQUENCE 5-like [Vigna angularis]|uniref:protein FAR1-RELATED SEQUENCE 5-like n=1 Tax=Phaseolus angularis TaxID=3914 RepID=UPI0022B4624A|nr:protein FAR1-RELATED SEQUENCE 5-like [Vigna angularis]
MACEEVPCAVNNDSNQNVNDIVPKIHMWFDTIEEVKSFYTDYAVRSGFGVRIRTSRRNKNNDLIFLKLVCSREGKYLTSIAPEWKTQPTQKNQCPAGITVVMKEGRWQVRIVVIEHSHDMCPNNSNLIRGNRRINMHAKHTLNMNDNSGVRINKSFISLVNEAGGFENMQFVERDARNYIGQQRRDLCKEGDGQTLLRYFSRMRELNNDFFYDMEMDDDNRISSVFWADARSRAPCVDFGDVVSFDTTYLTNKYDMPFEPFVGVNHHGHSVLLGCALISAEDTRTFTWLFSTWLRCMSNKAPEGIVTDQCKAMSNAINLVFPNTKHRWCLWHIMKKIPEKLQGYKCYKPIKSELKRLVYDTVSYEDFELGWANLMSCQGLENNDWLNSLYADRQRWVPCYMKHQFWAGMSTTQRSEGMNAFFDGFINSSTTLQQFVHQYNNALRQKAQKELEADFSSMNTTLPCGSQSLIERQYQTEYTQAKFVEVQNEFRSRMNCFIKNMTKEGTITRYTVKEDVIWEGECRSKFHVVVFDPVTTYTHCSCQLFEFRGILCRHSLLVLGQEDVRNVPTKYVLRRWSKNVRRRHTLIKASYTNNIEDSNMQRYQALCKRFYDIAEVACDSETASDNLLSDLNCIAKTLGVCTSTTLSMVNDASHMDGRLHCNEDVRPSFEIDGLLVRSLVAVKRKGRPRTKRLQSTVEKITKKKKSHATKTKHARNSNDTSNQDITDVHNVQELPNEDMFESQDIGYVDRHFAAAFQNELGPTWSLLDNNGHTHVVTYNMDTVNPRITNERRESFIYDGTNYPDTSLFSVKLTKSQARGSHLDLQIAFGNLIRSKGLTQIMLLGQKDGVMCSVLVSVTRNSTKFGKGWKEFCTEYGLKEGDVLVFEVNNLGNDILVEVYINGCPCTVIHPISV